jgi:hypothetical protein
MTSITPNFFSSNNSDNHHEQKGPSWLPPTKLVSSASGHGRPPPEKRPRLKDPSFRFTARLILEQSPDENVLSYANLLRSLLTQMGGDVHTVYAKKRMSPVTFVNVQVFIEHIFVANVQHLFPAGKTFLLVNHVFLTDWDLSRMLDSSITGICKSKAGLLALETMGVEAAHLLGFGKPESGCLHIPAVPRKISGTILHVAGGNPLKGGCDTS